MTGEPPLNTDRPEGVDPDHAEMKWVSDALVEQLSRLDLGYIALVPGSSYRGLHDSLVNYKGNTDPQILLCLHEEHCVAIAHGYAKVTGKPMAAAVHANVGLMHASMALYNAYCDRVPLLVVGANGPVDAARRRPWIDWVHTAADPGALVRAFVKWDDQPASLGAALSSFTQGTALTRTKPCAPVYICLDVELQEQKLESGPVMPTTERYLQLPKNGPSEDDVTAVRQLLEVSHRPLFLFGRMNRSQAGWDARVALAEHYNAFIATDLKQAAVFPTDHRLYAAEPSIFTSPKLCELIQEADVIVAFDWVDLAGTFKAAIPENDVHEPTAKVVHATLDGFLSKGWTKEHFARPPVDISIAADPDEMVSALLAASQGEEKHISKWGNVANKLEPETVIPREDDHISMTDLAEGIYAAIPADKLCLIRLPLGWNGRDLRATHPLSYLGYDGGAGLASGPGMAVGAALALKDTDFVPVAVLGDGDFLMGSSALWTAAHYGIPLLVVIANNASFYNDEVHQERVASARQRPVENKWIGVRIDDPLPDLGRNAASFGATVLGGQVKTRTELAYVLERAVAAFREKRTVVVVYVAVPPDGYS